MNAMRHINLGQITVSSSSNNDGDKLYDYLCSYALTSEVVIQIDSNSILSTSFLNSSFGKFINDYGIDLFKRNVKINTNANQFNRLKNYIVNYTLLYA